MFLKMNPIYMEEAGGESGEGGGDQGGGGDPTPWTAGFDEAQLGYVEAKGYKTPGDVLNSAIEGEQYITKLNGGKGRDQFLEKPDASKPESVKAFYQQLGTPEDADGYEGIEIGERPMAEGFDEKFKAAAHKYNLTAEQAKGLFNEVADQTTSDIQGIIEANQERDALGEQNLQKEWGGDFGANAAAAGYASEQLGVSGEEVDAIQQALGYEATMKLFHNIAQNVLDPQSPDTGNGMGEFQMGEAGAKNQIETLKLDSGFREMLMDSGKVGHQEAKQKWDRLHKLAYPGTMTM